MVEVVFTVVEVAFVVVGPSMIGVRIGFNMGSRIGIEGRGMGKLISAGSRPSRDFSTTIERRTRGWLMG